MDQIVQISPFKLGQNRVLYIPLTAIFSFAKIYRPVTFLLYSLEMNANFFSK